MPECQYFFSSFPGRHSKAVTAKNLAVLTNHSSCYHQRMSQQPPPTPSATLSHDHKTKRDPVVYLLLLLLVAGQGWALFRSQATEDVIRENNSTYQKTVFDNSTNKGVMHQVFRQNEVNRELLKATLRICAKD